MANLFSFAGWFFWGGTGGSFQNYGTGSQNFETSVIKSDSCSCVQRRNGSSRVVYHGGGGPQYFSRANINGVGVESASGASSSYGIIHCAGTCRSFNNHGRGSQNFAGAVINSGQI